MTASVKTIQKRLGLEPRAAKAVRAAMQLGEAGGEKAGKAMDIIDSLLVNDGVEAVRGDYVSSFWQDTVALYSNTGETYSTTVIFETKTRRFVIMDLGTWDEYNGKKFGVF